ncbi:hypothetical protein [Massilia varians]|uniref:hypothetical protein n=1 Tax=Massilia varians TaxID=457921 RepID=UPI0025575A88|nr:hypothetical protein [Massilia varians]MDK6076030.1 hypothetical protein [Massilia varians]
MKPMFLMAAAGVLMAAPFAHAQQSSRAPDPADPGVAVPQPVYRSAVSDYSRLPLDSATSPDQTWRQMNEAVAEAPAHAAHGAARTPAPAPAHGAAVAPATPAQAPRPAAGHDAHRHH